MKYRKVKRLIKRTSAVLVAGMAVGTVGVLPIIGPVTNVYADQETVSNFNNALNQAKKITGLKVNKKQETVTVSSADEAKALIDIETAKLKTAINTQRLNNQEYTQKLNDPNEVFDGLPIPAEGFSRDNLVNLLTNQYGNFDYANINILSTNHSEKEVYYQRPEVVKTGLDGQVNFVRATVGDWVLFKNAVEIRDAKDKYLDMKVTVISLEDAEPDAVYDLEYSKGITSSTERGGASQYTSFIKYRAEFLEPGTNNPVSTTVISLLCDLDTDEEYKAKTPFDKTSVSDLVGSNVIHSAGGFKGTEMGTSETAGNRGFFILRDKSSFEFEWNTYYFNWRAPDFDTKPIKREDSTVNVKEYTFKQRQSKTVKRTIRYQYEDGTTAFDPVTQEVELVCEGTLDPSTETTTWGDWTTGEWGKVNSPEKSGYTVDKASVAKQTVNNSTKDTTVVVTYRSMQKGSVTFNDKTTGEEIAEKKDLVGVSNSPFNYTPDETINNLFNSGYDLVSNNFPSDVGDQKFDTDPDRDQDYRVVMTPHIETIPHDNPKNEGDETDRTEVTYPGGVSKNDLNKTLKRTIYYKYDSADGEDVFEPVVQKVSLHRDATFNYVTKEVQYTDWTTGVIKDVTSPEKENYIYDRSSVEGVPNVTVSTKLENQYVIYKKIPQKGSVDFKDRDSGEDVEPTKQLNGYQAEPFNYTPNSTIQKMKNNGYDLVSNDFPTDAKDQVYDKDTTVDQNFHVVVTPHIEIIPHDNPKKSGDPTDRKNVEYPEGVDEADLNKTFKRTVYYKYDSADGEDVFEPVEQTVTLTRDATFNYVTKEVVYSDWTTASIDDVTSQVKEHWQFDREVVEGVDLTHESEALEDQYVIYTKVPEKGSVTFADDKGAEIADTVPLNGFDEDPFGYDPKETLDDLHSKGWDFVTSNYPEKEEDRVFDSDPTVDQDYTIIHTPHVETITPDDPKKAGDPTDRDKVTYPEGVDEADLNKTFKRTVYFKYDSKEGKDVFEPVVQEVHLTREAYFNYVTGEVEYSEWTTDTMDAVAAKQKDGYKYDRELVDLVNLTADMENPADEYIIYTAIPAEPETTPNTNKTVGPVNTGDGNNATPFIATALASVGGLFATMIGLKARSKRKKNEE